MGSKRLPGKSLMKISDKSMLEQIIFNIKDSIYIDKIIVATSNLQIDDAIDNLCKDLNILCHRGDPDNVLSRYIKITQKYNYSHLIRLTGDNPFVESTLLNYFIENYLVDYKTYDYVNNIDSSGFPYGLYIELFNSKLLNLVEKNGTTEDKEHVTKYFRDRKNEFKLGTIKTNKKFRYNRLTVDTLEELQNAKKIMRILELNEKKFTFYDL